MNYFIFRTDSINPKSAHWSIFDCQTYEGSFRIAINPTSEFIENSDFKFDAWLENLNDLYSCIESDLIETIYISRKIAHLISNNSQKIKVISNSLEFSHISTELIVAEWLVKSKNPASITFKGFDFKRDSTYLNSYAKEDLNLLEKIITTYSGNLSSPGAEFFNLFVEHFKKNKDFKYNTIDISHPDAINTLHALVFNATKHINSDNCFTTLCSNGYEWGTIALCKSLRKFHDEPIVIFYTDNTDIEIIKENSGSDITFIHTPVLQINSGNNIDDKYFNTLNKFLVFALTHFKKIVYLDSDMLILGRLDIFLKHGYNILTTQTQDRGITNPAMAVCIFSLNPTYNLFSEFIKCSVEFGDKGRGDHPYFINYYKNNYDLADYRYNISHVPYMKTGISIPKDTRAIHYHGFKPWDEVRGRGSYFADTDLHRLWFSNFSYNELLNYTMWLRCRQLSNEAKNYYLRYKKTISDNSQQSKII